MTRHDTTGPSPDLAASIDLAVSAGPAAATDLSASVAVATAEMLLPVEHVTGGLRDVDHGSLAGLAGTALLHARLSSVDARFADAARRHWTCAAAVTRRGPGAGPAGVFTGPGALAASLILGSPYLPDPDRYTHHTTTAARWLSARAVAIVEQQRGQTTAGVTTTPWHVYDAINGLSGIGRILLAATRLDHHAGQHAGRDGLTASLTTLTEMINNQSCGRRPGWWLPAEHHPTATTATVPASGAATTGVAHGIAGPLAFLAAARAAGVEVSGQDTAIRHAAGWLLHWQEAHPARTWPPFVTGGQFDRDAPAAIPGRRHAWCYGTPGISRALTLAADTVTAETLADDTLADDTIRAAADHATAAMAGLPRTAWDIDGPSLCHGYAGVLLAAPHPLITSQAATAITAAFNPLHRYGFTHHEHGTPTDEPGLLTGAAGIALTLADHGQLPHPAVITSWDSLLLAS